MLTRSSERTSWYITIHSRYITNPSKSKPLYWSIYLAVWWSTFWAIFCSVTRSVLFQSRNAMRISGSNWMRTVYIHSDVYICMHIYMYIYIHIYVCVYVNICPAQYPASTHCGKSLLVSKAQRRNSVIAVTINWKNLNGLRIKIICVSLWIFIVKYNYEWTKQES